MRLFLIAAVPVALLLYGQALAAPYYLDDFVVLESASTLPALLSPRSLAYATFFLSAQTIDLFAGIFYWDTTFYFRLGNLVIHVLTATLVVGLVSALTKRHAPGFAAGALFLVHPIVSQPVMYISQRFESLATLFMVASLTAYVHFRNRGSTAWLAVTGACAVAAVLSKETAVVLPLWILLAEVVFFRSGTWDRRYLYAAPAVALLALPGWWAFRGSAETLTSVPWDQYIVSQGSVLSKYLQLSLYPARQFLHYGPGAVPDSIWVNLAGWILVLGVLALGVVLLRRQRIIGFGILTAFVMLLPVTLLPLPDPIFEHRIYPAFVGLAIAAAGLFGLHARRLTVVLTVVVLATYGVRTFNRAAEWNNELAFFEAHRTAFPEDSRMLSNLAVRYRVRGHIRRAMETLEEARRHEDLLNSYYSTDGRLNVALNIAAVSLTLGDVERAEDEIRRALAIDPNSSRVRQMEGAFYVRIGEPQRAALAYERLLEIVPNSLEGWTEVRDVYLAIGDQARADRAGTRIAELSPVPGGRDRARPVSGANRTALIFGLLAFVLGVVAVGGWSAWTGFRRIKDGLD